MGLVLDTTSFYAESGGQVCLFVCVTQGLSLILRALCFAREPPLGMEGLCIPDCKLSSCGVVAALQAATVLSSVGAN